MNDERNNIHGWRDVAAVLRLKVPPYRWKRCIPLVFFSLGYERQRDTRIVKLGWWGMKW